MCVFDIPKCLSGFRGEWKFVHEYTSEITDYFLSDWWWGCDEIKSQNYQHLDLKSWFCTNIIISE